MNISKIPFIFSISSRRLRSRSVSMEPFAASAAPLVSFARRSPRLRAARGGVRRVDGPRDDLERRVELAPLLRGGEPSRDESELRLRRVVVLAVAGNDDFPDDPEVLKGSDVEAHVAPARLQPFRHLVETEWARAQIEEGLDLGHHLSDAPVDAHAAPAPDENIDGVFGRVVQIVHVVSLWISL